MTAFKGEQAVTGALMELVEGKKNAIGYVIGHKEPTIADAPPPDPLGHTAGSRAGAMSPSSRGAWYPQ